MKLPIFVCVSLSLAVSLAAQSQPGITGKWTTQTEVQGIAVNETCMLKQAADGALTGTCDTPGGKFAVTGKANGGNVTFSHPAAYQGEDMTVSFFGKLDSPESITGSIDMQPINAGGAFAMKKIGN
ncbi:hypothetical protein [Terriglobus sp. TAA 43]|uniref:hypothetical protein n=1 Tax=Terriglobus sp. TAA 43 TaxID=278961 RepID=UPI0006484347|nr:hypothetical protein [Terriglobus sp. TAA 43]